MLLHTLRCVRSLPCLIHSVSCNGTTQSVSHECTSICKSFASAAIKTVGVNKLERFMHHQEMRALHGRILVTFLLWLSPSLIENFESADLQRTSTTFASSLPKIGLVKTEGRPSLVRMLQTWVCDGCRRTNPHKEVDHVTTGSSFKGARVSLPCICSAYVYKSLSMLD